MHCKAPLISQIRFRFFIVQYLLEEKIDTQCARNVCFIVHCETPVVKDEESDHIHKGNLLEHKGDSHYLLLIDVL